jgi:hypothetical protein
MSKSLLTKLGIAFGGVAAGVATTLFYISPSKTPRLERKVVPLQNQNFQTSNESGANRNIRDNEPSPPIKKESEDRKTISQKEIVEWDLKEEYIKNNESFFRDGNTKVFFTAFVGNLSTGKGRFLSKGGKEYTPQESEKDISKAMEENDLLVFHYRYNQCVKIGKEEGIYRYPYSIVLKEIVERKESKKNKEICGEIKGNPRVNGGNMRMKITKVDKISNRVQELSAIEIEEVLAVKNGDRYGMVIQNNIPLNLRAIPIEFERSGRLIEPPEMREISKRQGEMIGVVLKGKRYFLEKNLEERKKIIEDFTLGRREYVPITIRYRRLLPEEK